MRILLAKVVVYDIEKDEIVLFELTCGNGAALCIDTIFVQIGEAQGTYMILGIL